ncbi:uncharacterized protein [Diabrotica undecimpunctata]|uniref:uncharacterized protein n=1 Tax=Diabrotica undecimpunctata TaxID=50387 RepID=UPI003B63AC07
MPNTVDMPITPNQGGLAETVHHTVQTVFSIESYDVSKKFDRWLMRLESAFKVFGIPEGKQSAFLLHYMGPEAYDILCDKLSPQIPDAKSYDEVVNIMKEHYNPEPLEIAEIFRFIQRKQIEGESVKDYLTVLQRLAITCNFSEYQKKALRNQFVFGLCNERIHSRLLEIKYLTIERAIEVALSMETSARDAAQLHKSHAGMVNKVSVEKKTEKSANTTSRNVSNSGNHVNKVLNCFRCGSEQHLANKCLNI